MHHLLGSQGFAAARVLRFVANTRRYVYRVTTPQRGQPIVRPRSLNKAQVSYLAASCTFSSGRSLKVDVLVDRLCVSHLEVPHCPLQIVFFGTGFSLLHLDIPGCRLMVRNWRTPCSSHGPTLAARKSPVWSRITPRAECIAYHARPTNPSPASFIQSRTRTTKLPSRACVTLLAKRRALSLERSLECARSEGTSGMSHSAFKRRRCPFIWRKPCGCLPGQQYQACAKPPRAGFSCSLRATRTDHCPQC